jgi:hypothetical protein
MTLDYSKKGCVSIIMRDYIQGMLDELPPSMDGFAATPASENLFISRADNDRTLLSEEDSDLYHHNTAKLLFLCKRARPDVQTAVSFLTTRVKSPDVDDLKKLQRCMRYLRSTIDIVLTLEATHLNCLAWYVDSSYAVHPDMRGHTGVAFTMGKGAIQSIAKKHKLNTKSSTEAEVVGADEALSPMLWTLRFLEAQGHQIDKNVLYQDNQSAMLLETYGRASSTKRTKHMDVRYFFIADRVAKGDLTIEYCSTDEMWADFFTKPLQGYKFKLFRNLIMNITDGVDSPEPSKSPQERVDDTTSHTG